MNEGLCVVTTRLPIDDLEAFEGSTVEHIRLDNLSNAGGRNLLSHFGAWGIQNELSEAVDEYEGHALALTLLARFLVDTCNGDITQRVKVCPLENYQGKQGAHTRRVLHSYEEWLDGRAELSLLLVLSLFPGIVVESDLMNLLERDQIDGLTKKLKDLDAFSLRQIRSNLRRMGLINEKVAEDQPSIDCHPLIKEHFQEKLRLDNSAAWARANCYLYEYYKTKGNDSGNSLGDIMPLFSAVVHGCRAGLYNDARTEVFRNRILRNDKFFAWYRLGAYALSLETLAHFFDVPWDTPVPDFSEEEQAHLLCWVGTCLLALGRLTEAVKPMTLSYNLSRAAGTSYNVSQDAGTLSYIWHAKGRLEKAVGYAAITDSQAIMAAKKPLVIGNPKLDSFLKNEKRQEYALHHVELLLMLGRDNEASDLVTQIKRRLRKNKALEVSFYASYAEQRLDRIEFDVLLARSQKEKRDLRKKLKYHLEKMRTYYDAMTEIRSNPSVLAICERNIGRVYLGLAQTQARGNEQSAMRHLEPAREMLNLALTNYRKAQRRHRLLYGLLTMAAFHRISEDYESALAILSEAEEIAMCGCMDFFMIKIFTESYLLSVDRDLPDEVQASYRQALELCNKCDYVEQRNFLLKHREYFWKKGKRGGRKMGG